MLLCDENEIFPFIKLIVLPQPHPPCNVSRLMNSNVVVASTFSSLPD